MQDPGILIGYTTVESHLPQIINSTIAPNYAQSLFIGLNLNMLDYSSPARKNEVQNFWCEKDFLVLTLLNDNLFSILAKKASVERQQKGLKFCFITLLVVINYGRDQSGGHLDLDPKSKSGFFNLPDFSQFFLPKRQGKSRKTWDRASQHGLNFGTGRVALPDPEVSG